MAFSDLSAFNEPPTRPPACIFAHVISTSFVRRRRRRPFFHGIVCLPGPRSGSRGTRSVHIHTRESLFIWSLLLGWSCLISLYAGGLLNSHVALRPCDACQIYQAAVFLFLILLIPLLQIVSALFVLAARTRFNALILKIYTSCDSNYITAYIIQSAPRHQIPRNLGRPTSPPGRACRQYPGKTPQR